MHDLTPRGLHERDRVAQFVRTARARVMECGSQRMPFEAGDAGEGGEAFTR